MNKFPKLKVKSFTVSYAFDAHLNGKKSNNFVSMGFELTEPVSVEEAQILQLQASQIVTAATIHDAVARGLPTQEASELIQDMKTRHEGMVEKLSEKSDPSV